MLREGIGHYQACRNIGVSPAEVKKRIDVDADFAEKVQEAEEEFLEQLEQQYIENAKAGGTRELTDILTKRYNRKWADRPAQVEISGTIEHDISALPLMEQIGVLHKILEERARLRQGEQLLELEALPEDD